MSAAPLRTLLLGAGGHFGSRIAKLLQGVPGIELVPMRRTDLDLDDSRFAGRLQERSPGLVINAVGPFQSQDYRVAQACIAAGSHYVDIADARGFVCGIRALDAAARAANVCVVSGASSVPALSAAAIAPLAEGLGRVQAIDFGITTSSRPPGEATLRAVLAGAGRELPQRRDGRAFAAVGGLHGCCRAIEGVGTRRFVPCDVPDLDLLAERYPQLESLRFGAGSESAVSHRVLGAIARAVSAGWVADAARFARPLAALARVVARAGTGRSAMYVEVRGRDARGAFPAAGLVSLEDYLAELSGLDIHCRASEDAGS